VRRGAVVRREEYEGTEFVFLTEGGREFDAAEKVSVEDGKEKDLKFEEKDGD
jgi:hypothetical protein